MGGVVMDIQLGLEILLLLFGVAMLAGFVDAMAGGGGLLTIPALLLSGVPPIATLATNKLQASAGSFSASLTMIKKGVVHPAQIKIALLMAFVGSAIAPVLVQFISCIGIVSVIGVVALVGATLIALISRFHIYLLEG